MVEDVMVLVFFFPRQILHIEVNVQISKSTHVLSDHLWFGFFSDGNLCTVTSPQSLSSACSQR